MAKVTQLRLARQIRGREDDPTPVGRPLAPAHRTAIGYSAFVWSMKIALPAVALLLILMVGVWPQLNRDDDRFQVGLAEISPEDARDLRMIRPRYQGIDARGQPFVITADSAIKKDPDDDLVELQSPQADVTLEDGTWIALKAELGAFREGLQLIELSGGVNVFHDDGYEFRTEHARVHIEKGYAEGYAPVVGHGPFGEIHSQGFQILDKGQRVVFLGKTNLVLRQVGDGADSVTFK